MENSNINKLTQQSGIKTLPLSILSMVMLCAYLTANALTYINEIPSSFVTLALYGFLATALLSIFIYGKLRIYSHTIWCAVFILFCCISCIYSAGTDRSLEAVISLIKMLMFTLMLCNIAMTEQRMKTAMAVCSLATIVLFAYLAVNGQLEMEEGERLGNELTGNANIFATLFMIGGMCSVYLTFFAEKRFFRILFFAVFITQFIALTMSGGRKYLIVLILLIAGMQLMRTDRKGRRHLLTNLLLVSVALSALWWALFNVEFMYDAVGYRMEGLVASLTGEGDVDASTLERQAMIEKGLELWGESPLWGHGIHAFSVLTQWGVYAHNNYVELLCDIGIAGALIYYAYYVYLLQKLIKAPIHKLRKSFWILLLIGFLIYDLGAVGYDSFLQHMMLVFAMQAAEKKAILAQDKMDEV